MALILLPRVLWTILKVLQKFEISHLSVEVPNIKIWTLLSFSRDFLRFISCFLQMTIVVLPRALKTISTILYKIGIGQFGAKVTNIAIWVLFSLSYKFFYFSPIFYKWPSYRFSWFSKWIWKLFENLKLVILVLRWLISTFG